MVLAKAYLGQEYFEKAEGFANSAYEKAVGMKYRWAEITAGSLPKACRDSGCGGFVGGDILGQG